VMEGLMLGMMFELPERTPGQTYIVTEGVVRGEESMFPAEPATN
jgi:ATP-dependent Clp protease ATP-binding subunit ClpX